VASRVRPRGSLRDRARCRGANPTTTAPIDLARNRAAARIPIPAGSGIAVAAVPGWVADGQGTAVYRIDLYANG
jgi:hypothetical protein